MGGQTRGVGMSERCPSPGLHAPPREGASGRALTQDGGAEDGFEATSSF